VADNILINTEEAYVSIFISFLLPTLSMSESPRHLENTNLSGLFIQRPVPYAYKRQPMLSISCSKIRLFGGEVDLVGRRGALRCTRASACSLGTLTCSLLVKCCACEEVYLPQAQDSVGTTFSVAAFSQLQ
jgi:hypothetical protein